MDLIFKRYSSPFEIMEQMILCGRFHEFVTEFIDNVNEDTLWESYLHYPFPPFSFDKFKEMLKNGSADDAQKRANLEATVKQSMNILDSFVPDDY